MKKAIIYARVSSTTDRQNTDRQVADLRKYANGYEIANVYEEHISGATKTKDRAVLLDAIAYCEDEANECKDIFVSELSRLGRNIDEVLSMVLKFKQSLINVHFQKEGMSLFNEDGSENPFLMIMVSVLSTCAQMERDNIKFRLNSGRELAKLNGVKFGRKVGYRMTKQDYINKYPSLIKKMEERQRHLEVGIRDKDDSLRAIAKAYDVDLSTVQKIKKVFGF